VSVIRLAVSLVVMAVGTCTVDASERTAALVNSFQVFCTLETPDFAALDAKATGMKLPVDNDLGARRSEGQFVHSKTWVVGLNSGPHALLGSEARGPEGEIAGCGIADHNAPGEEFKQDLVKAMKLGAPLREATTPDGKRVTTWQYAGDILLLAEGTPSNQPSVYVTLIHKITAGH